MIKEVAVIVKGLDLDVSLLSARLQHLGLKSPLLLIRRLCHTMVLSHVSHVTYNIYE